jgi:hypothetical protein
MRGGGPCLSPYFFLFLIKSLNLELMSLSRVCFFSFSFFGCNANDNETKTKTNISTNKRRRKCPKNYNTHKIHTHILIKKNGFNRDQFIQAMVSSIAAKQDVEKEISEVPTNELSSSALAMLDERASDRNILRAVAVALRVLLLVLIYLVHTMVLTVSPIFLGKWSCSRPVLCFDIELHFDEIETINNFL